MYKFLRAKIQRSAQRVYLYFVWISEQTPIISLHSINRSVL
jgi:hypothetical protein